MAVYRAGTTSPVCKEELITLVMRGPMAPILAFTRPVGKRSRAQVVFFILLMMRTTYCCVVLEKQLRGWETSGCGIAARAGGDAEPGREERMPSTLALKKHENSLHCFSVASLCTDVWCLRRL